MQNTLHDQNYDSDCREPNPELRGALQLLCSGSTQACFGAAEPNSQPACMPEEAYAAQHTRTMARSATFDPRQRDPIGHHSKPQENLCLFRNRKQVLDPFFSTRSGRSTAVVRVSSRSPGDTRLSIFASPNKVYTHSLSKLAREPATCGPSCSIHTYTQYIQSTSHLELTAE